jgi:outer membrane protein OmpA-like peptidoglycan-associated protein
MKKLMSVFLATSFSLLTAASSSLAQEEPTSHHLILRGETALAAPLSDPQDLHYGIGGMKTVKGAVNLLPFLDVGGGFTYLGLSPNKDAYPSGNMGSQYAFGADVRLKRPMPANSKNDYWGGASPWIDGSAQVVTTGSLARLGLSADVGVAFPTNNRYMPSWSPFAGYHDIVDGTQLGGTTGRDTRDARTFVMGLEFEFDVSGKKIAYHHQRECCLPPAPPPEKKIDVEKKPQETTSKQFVTVNQEENTRGAIQFDFDSSKLDAESKDHLDRLADAVLKHLSDPTMTDDHVQVRHLEVDGFASSENHPWAEKHNQKLSEARAEAVADYLVSKGIKRDFITVKGFGTQNPLNSNKTEGERKQNRRVDFIVSVTYLVEVSK